jgi:hypothetical protein
MQNIRRGHYERDVEASHYLRLAAAFDKLREAN